MQLATYVRSLCAAANVPFDFAQVFMGPNPLVVVREDGDGPYIVTWTIPGVSQPTAAAFTAAMAAPEPGPSSADLVAYATAKQVGLRDAGITVNVGTASAPVEVDVASDVNGRNLVSGCVQLVGLAAQSNQAAPTFPWINNDGSTLTLTAAQIMTIGYALGTYVQATYAELGTVLAAIANGTITTTAGVDDANWPARTY